MDSERWRQIEELYHAVAECTPERRQALLAVFDSPERRLELFEVWWNSAGRAAAQQADSPQPEGSPVANAQ